MFNKKWKGHIQMKTKRYFLDVFLYAFVIAFACFGASIASAQTTDSGDYPNDGAINGINSSGIGSQGVNGVTTSITGSGVGVRGQSDSEKGKGVLGYATHTSGHNFGVYGSSDSSDGHGVFGTANGAYGFLGGPAEYNDFIYDVGVYGNSASGKFGVYGETATRDGAGVMGVNTRTGNLSWGVVGETKSEGGAGVLGINLQGGMAGLFWGSVEVWGDFNASGSISANVKSFKIDHPLDPENKYLYHTSIESPDMKNVYDGVIVLNEKGEAVVAMPDYFEALNGDYRYQLTAIGAPGPNLYISEEIKNNSFKIAGGKPGMKVSWQVTGIRMDAYAKMNRVKVVANKPEDERGTYLNPLAYGKPVEKGLEYAKRPKINIPEKLKLAGVENTHMMRK